ncbi:GcrA family cell cycle regulator [Terrarubrum flagellatum]|uniref:GcrA family cell cycle regulator n=1 Tax=Terrirubrum flagellatum TaxID=2895980 RepID=UPI003145287A
MSWTDERIELLKKLWTDGLSASQIASELGQVTRNAVIGKVHRLGLAGRAKAPTPTIARPARKPAPTHRISGGLGGGMSNSGGGVARAVLRGNTALKVMAAHHEDAYQVVQQELDEDVVIPMSQRVTIMELREGMCKWPMGDPSSAEFRYCGSQNNSGAGPYCAYHSRAAYQPPADRRRHDRRVMSRI